MKIIQLNKTNPTHTITATNMHIGMEHLFLNPLTASPYEVSISTTNSMSETVTYSYLINECDILEFNNLYDASVTINIGAKNWDNYAFITVAYD